MADLRQVTYQAYAVTDSAQRADGRATRVSDSSHYRLTIPCNGHAVGRMRDLLKPARIEQWRGRVCCPRAGSGAGGPALGRSDDPQLLHLVLERRTLHPELGGSAVRAGDYPVARGESAHDVVPLHAFECGWTVRSSGHGF